MTDHEQLIALADKTAETRRDTHLATLIDGLATYAGDDETHVETRKRIYSGIAFVDHDDARAALLHGLEHETNDIVVETLVQSYWRQARFVRQTLPGLVQEHWTSAPDATLTKRLIDVMKTHRIIEKIDPAWKAQAPAALVKLVTPRPLWA